MSELDSMAQGANATVRRLHVPPRRIVAALCAAALLVCAPTTFTPSASAFVLDGRTWTGGYFTYRINVASFASNFGSIALTQAEAEYWVAYSLSMWKERTGADLSFAYLGTTSNAPICDNWVPNGVSEIYVAPGCEASTGCNTWARARLSPGTGSVVSESDICIYGGSDPFTTSMNPSATEKDLIGILVHELGHTLGLDHTPTNPVNTVMEAAAFQLGNVLARYPYGDDIDGMRQMYPDSVTQTRRWRGMSGTSWGSQYTISGSTSMHSTAAVGVRSSGNRIVSTRVSPGGSRLYFARTDFPPSSSSSWAQTYYEWPTWRPAAITGRNESTELWVTAWAPKQVVATDCPGIRVATSTNGFSSVANQTTLTGGSSWCSTSHEPALTYDPDSNRFVMAFVLRPSPSQTVNKAGRVCTRTSTNGTSWTGSVCETYRTIDAVDLACDDDGSCVMAMIEGEPTSLPHVIYRSFTVDGAGAVDFDDYSLPGGVDDRTASVAVREYGGDEDWFFGVSRATSVTARANGSYSIQYDRDDGVPPGSLSFTSVDTAEHRADLAALPGLGGAVIVYVD